MVKIKVPVLVFLNENIINTSFGNGRVLLYYISFTKIIKFTALFYLLNRRHKYYFI